MEAGNYDTASATDTCFDRAFLMGLSISASRIKMKHITRTRHIVPWGDKGFPRNKSDKRTFFLIWKFA